MRNVTSAISRPLTGRVRWSTIGAAISLLIVGLAVVILMKLLHGVEFANVVAALRAKSLREVLLAGAFVALAYLTLSFYDFFALRTIGRNMVPYRVAAFAGFISYTIGHNLGATVFTAGAIRLRIYSKWGLRIPDVARMAFITGLTFWLGNAFVLGYLLSYAPELASAVDQLPPWVNRVAGLFGLLMILGYLLWLMPRPRAIGPLNWHVDLPNWRLTLVQIAIGTLDLSAGAAAMYSLLPSQPVVAPAIVLVTFVTAMLLGFLSHAPGTLGVLEATMLLGLPQFTREELLASLLMFRFLYFMLPLSVAALLLGARELSLLAGLAIKFPAGRKRLARCVRSAVGKSSRYAGSTRADTG